MLAGEGLLASIDGAGIQSGGTASPSCAMLAPLASSSALASPAITSSKKYTKNIRPRQLRRAEVSEQT
jgi:hypothetical protein